MFRVRNVRGQHCVVLLLTGRLVSPLMKERTGCTQLKASHWTEVYLKEFVEILVGATQRIGMGATWQRPMVGRRERDERQILGEAFRIQRLQSTFLWDSGPLNGLAGF